MKRLILLRHAKSSWEDNSLADSERPLAERGLRDAPNMAKRLAQRGVRPDVFITSPARRARHTAELVAAGIGSHAAEIRIDPRVYLASPGELLGIVSSLDDSWQEVVLVGHNPGFTQVANMMLPTLRLANLPTAGVVAIHCDTGHWRDISSSSPGLVFYDYPKNPEAAR